MTVTFVYYPKENNGDDDSLFPALFDVTYGLSHDTTWEDGVDDL